MKNQIVQLITVLLQKEGVDGISTILTRSENEAHGEYSTNIALLCAKSLKQNPKDIAVRFADTLNRWRTDPKKLQTCPVLHSIDRFEAVAPGFINIFVSDIQLIQSLDSRNWGSLNSGNLNMGIPRKDLGMTQETVMVEFAHPNTHKAFHIGHLRNITTGECIVRLLEAVGHKVIRANYQGDVGLHIAKALYGLLQWSVVNRQSSDNTTLYEKIAILARAYTEGNTAYEENDEAKRKIIAINNQIYEKNSEIYPLYEETRKWSLDYFDSIYKRVGSHFDRLYFESETYELGKRLVTEYVKKGVFEESDGAVIFPGKKYGLHNRVFITSEGNATYEGKDIGLAKLQFDEYHPDLVIHCVASEQTEYFRVLFKALEQVFPETIDKEQHLIYGWVRLKEGKMSSRTGNVVLGAWLIDEVKKEIRDIILQGNRGYAKDEEEHIAEKAAIAAVKYAFLKVSTQQEIAFDIKESVNLEGDSGPYLLYTYARCRSVVEKSSHRSGEHSTPFVIPAKAGIPSDQKIPARAPLGRNDKSVLLNPEERAVARLLLYFPEIVTDAAGQCAPNTLCTYLFRLSQAYNALYNKHQIMGDSQRLMLTEKTAQVLHQGLYLLGIETVEKM